jgi:hypothetical protein
MARPSFKPTAIQRRNVAIVAAGGMAHEDIAVALQISRNTLEKHFKAELSAGTAQKRMEILLSLFRAGKKGNVSAQKAFLAFVPTIGAPSAKQPGTDIPVKEPKAEPIGKKEQAQKDAVTAHVGTGWDDLLRPPGPVQ